MKRKGTVRKKGGGEGRHEKQRRNRWTDVERWMMSGDSVKQEAVKGGEMNVTEMEAQSLSVSPKDLRSNLLHLILEKN